MPENTYVITPKTAKRAETDNSDLSPLSPAYLNLPEDKSVDAADNEAHPSHAERESSMPSPSARDSKPHKTSRSMLSRASLRQSLSWAQQAHQNKTKADALSLAKLPFLPGCESDGPAAREMTVLFPATPLADIVRFLVARKGDVKAAAEMMTKALEWHRAHFPLPPALRTQVESAFSAGCFFTHGQARDGTPVLYMRGALYDGSKASPEAYVLAAAHAITYALSQSAELSVTVVVHAVNVPGAPNDNADLTFIKGFISVLSDNFPERLKRLAIFPFPWYGRAIWSILKVFVDKRTQNKVMLLSGDGASIPSVRCRPNLHLFFLFASSRVAIASPSSHVASPISNLPPILIALSLSPPQELSELLDPDQIPTCCGGRSKAKVLDMKTTL